MSMEQPGDGERVEQEFRIVELQGMAEELNDGQMESWESPDCPPEIREQFWESVLAFENAPETTLTRKFAELGVELPPADALNDEQLTAKLWEVIHRLADMRTYLHSTDHLSDRELYTMLRDDLFNEEFPDVPPSVGMNHHFDLVSSGSKEDIVRWLTYYADDDTRRRWVEDYPEYALPQPATPPYDRDRLLAQPDYSAGLLPEIELN